MPDTTGLRAAGLQAAGAGLRVAVSGSADSADEVEFVREAERLGADSAWVPELWGYDALTQAGYLAARTSRIVLGTSIVQLGSRSPALLATSAMSLQQLTGGRFRLGIGVSGPQVMEGWHGVRFRRPVQTTRETIEIIAMISRGDRLEYQGQIYQLPLPGQLGPGAPACHSPGAGADLRSRDRPGQPPAVRRIGRWLARQRVHPRVRGRVRG